MAEGLGRFERFMRKVLTGVGVYVKWGAVRPFEVTSMRVWVISKTQRVLKEPFKLLETCSLGQRRRVHYCERCIH